MNPKVNRKGAPRKQRCKRGHPLRGPGADVALNAAGQVRNCRRCNRERERERRERERERRRRTKIASASNGD